MEEQEEQRQACFSDRNDVHEERHVQVVAEYDKQIEAAVKAAEAAAAAAKPKTKASVATAEPPAVEPTVEPVLPTPPEAAKEKTKEEKAKEKKAKKELEDAREAFKQLEKEAVFAKEDLPDLSDCAEMKDGAAEALGMMYLWARASALGDAHVPFTFAEMGATTKVAADLVGKKVWDAFFGFTTPINDQSVCPMRLRQVMFLQLMTYDAALKAKVHATKHAEVAASLEQSQLRLSTMKSLVRSSPYA